MSGVEKVGGVIGLRAGSSSTPKRSVSRIANSVLSGARSCGAQPAARLRSAAPRGRRRGSMAPLACVRHCGDWNTCPLAPQAYVDGPVIQQ